MSAPPLIALTIYHPNAEGRVNLPAEYHEAVRRAGGRALLIPPGEPDIGGLVDIVDGIVLSGGGDLDPAVLGGPTHPTIYDANALRDNTELELVRCALDRKMPTLAVCRGLQVLNVALGGTLHPHLPDVFGETVLHRTDPPGPIAHSVRVEAGSLIAESMGSTEVETASWHHQCVDRLGDGLRIVAEAPDGVIEAVELEEQPFLQAVQWHPEITAAEDPTQQGLFDALVEHASA